MSKKICIAGLAIAFAVLSGCVYRGDLRDGRDGDGRGGGWRDRGGWHDNGGWDRHDWHDGDSHHDWDHHDHSWR